MSEPALILMGLVLVVVFGGCVLVSVAAWRQEVRRRQRRARAESDREPT